MCRPIKPGELSALMPPSEPGKVERCIFVLNQLITAKSNQFKDNGKVVIPLSLIEEFDKNTIQEALDKFIRNQWFAEIKYETYIVFKSRIKYH